ncbi:MAG: GGDEF domain-containing protein [Candidatus Brocadiales bacterium]|nr:GGDEF domain-containing protein [Candidatus Brocadiales bacterium]
MLEQILCRLKTATLWRLFWFSVILSELLTAIIVLPMSVFFQGRIASDYLITGSITAFFVSLIVVVILVLLIKELRKDEKSLNEQNRRIFELSIRDYLTEVFNCRYFYERLEEEIKRAERYKSAFSLIILDIDHFKKYNDAHGHQAGDRVLKDVASFLKKHIRDHDLIARYGGEEFSVILPETVRDVAINLAERLRIAVSDQPFPFVETQPDKRLTVSIGIATFPDDAKSIDDLVKVADRALYRAKENGRNRVETAEG